jgi:hypothetical protein
MPSGFSSTFHASPHRSLLNVHTPAPRCLLYQKPPVNKFSLVCSLPFQPTPLFSRTATGIHESSKKPPSLLSSLHLFLPPLFPLVFGNYRPLSSFSASREMASPRAEGKACIMENASAWPRGSPRSDRSGACRPSRLLESSYSTGCAGAAKRHPTANRR